MRRTQAQYLSSTTADIQLVIITTDMDACEIITYFKKATLDDGSGLELQGDPSIPITFSLRAPTTDNPIFIYYYAQAQGRIDAFNLKHTNKKHLVIIQDEDYQAAKDSL